MRCAANLDVTVIEMPKVTFQPTDPLAKTHDTHPPGCDRSLIAQIRMNSSARPVATGVIERSMNWPGVLPMCAAPITHRRKKVLLARRTQRQLCW